MKQLIIPFFAIILVIYLVILFVIKTDTSKTKIPLRKAQIMIVSAILIFCTYFLPWIESNLIGNIKLNAFEAKEVNMQFTIFVFGAVISCSVILISGIVQLFRPLKKNTLFVIIESAVFLIPVFFLYLFYRFIPIANGHIFGVDSLKVGVSISYGFVMNFALVILTLIILLFLNFEQKKE